MNTSSAEPQSHWLCSLLQLEGFRLQLKQKQSEEADTWKSLEQAKVQMAASQGDPDVPYHPDVLASVREAYTSAQVNTVTCSCHTPVT
jgi:hypothetical protein